MSYMLNERATVLNPRRAPWMWLCAMHACVVDITSITFNPSAVSK